MGKIFKVISFYLLVNISVLVVLAIFRYVQCASEAIAVDSNLLNLQEKYPDEKFIEAQISNSKKQFKKQISYFKNDKTGVFKIALSTDELGINSTNDFIAITENKSVFSVYNIDQRRKLREKMFSRHRYGRSDKEFESFPKYIDKKNEINELQQEYSKINQKKTQIQQDKNNKKRTLYNNQQLNKTLSDEDKNEIKKEINELDERLNSVHEKMRLIQEKLNNKRKELEDVIIDIQNKILAKQPYNIIYGRFNNTGEAHLIVSNKNDEEKLLEIKFKLPEENGGASEILNEWKNAHDFYYLKITSLTPGDSVFPYIQSQSVKRIGLETYMKISPQGRNIRGRMENANLYSITSGSLAIQESLQLDRMTEASKDRSNSEIPIEKLAGPAIKSHPFEHMIDGRKPVYSDMANLVPEEFYYLHFTDINKEIELSDLLDQWGTSLLNVMHVSSHDAQIKEKYLTQLSIKMSLLTRLFGDRVIDDLAIVGSDPFLHEGTDISVIFNVKNKKLFDLAMSKDFDETKNLFPDAVESTVTYGNYSIYKLTTPDKTVSSYSTYLDDYKVYSNSQKAIELIIDSCIKKHTSLSRSKDFLYMRTIFKGTKSDEDTFFYMSESNIRKLVGPQWKIARKRRLECNNSLRIINNAVTLYFSEKNTASPDLDTLIKSRYLEDSYLYCPDGGSYILDKKSLEPSCSKHGRLRYLTPVIEMPVKTVSKTEQEEYDNFVREYNSYWSKFFDPIGIRVKSDDSTIKLETCILPLIENSIYNGLKFLSGGESVDINSPRTKDTIFQIITKINMTEDSFKKTRWLRNFVAKTSLSSKKFLDMIGDNVSINSVDDSMMFSVDLAGGGAFLGGFLRDRASIIAGSFITSAISLPTYIAISVKDEQLAKQFIHEALGSIAEENAYDRMKSSGGFGSFTAYAYEVLPSYKGNIIETLDMQFFILRVRLHFMVYNKHIFISNQRDVLTKIIDNPNKLTKAQSNVMLNIRSSAFNRMADLVKLEWQERMRKVCVNNLGSIYSLHKFRNVPFNEINKASLAINGFYPYCPSGGEYAYNENKNNVVCSVHGDNNSPRQPFDINPEIALNKFVSSIDRLETSLKFTPEGIMTTVTIERCEK